VKLVSTYWSVPHSSDATVLWADGSVVVVPTPNCRAGARCELLVESFKAVHVGRTDVISSRTICGEDLKCKPGEMYFRVTVIVSSRS
jgi:prepilin-type processing-associated H-X9-DG protein